jgi:hypothetical protein
LNSREVKINICFILATTTSQFIILLPEAVTNREEVPTPLLIHIPYICLLTCILCVWFVDEMHKEKPVTKKKTSKCKYLDADVGLTVSNVMCPHSITTQKNTINIFTVIITS